MIDPIEFTYDDNICMTCKARMDYELEQQYKQEEEIERAKEALQYDLAESNYEDYVGESDEQIDTELSSE